MPHTTSWAVASLKPKCDSNMQLLPRVRQGEQDAGAEPLVALGPDAAVVQLDESTRHGEAETGPLVKTPRRRLDLVERLEHFLQMLRANARSGVAHLHARETHCRVRPDANAHLTRRGRKAEGIVQEVEQNLAQPLGFSRHR